MSTADDDSSRRRTPEPENDGASDDAGAGDERVGGLSDLFKRAVAAGVGAARTSKEEMVRAAAGEMRGWLDHLDLETELVKALLHVRVEIKTEIRFLPSDDGGVKPEVTNEAVLKKS